MTQFSWPHPDTENLKEILPEPLRAWLGGVNGESSGPNLEYDPRFLELQQAAAGKPETQFSDAQPPVWSAVQQQAEGLLAESRDIRILFYWLESTLRLNGLNGLAPVVMVLANWIRSQWDTFHPALDPVDDDPFERLNALALLAARGSLFQAFRESSVLKSAHFGHVCVRHFEYAYEWAEPKQGEPSLSKPQLLALVESDEVNQSELSLQIAQARDAFTQLLSVLQSKVAPTDLPDFSLILDRLQLISQNLSEPVAQTTQVAATGTAKPLKAEPAAASSSISSRQQAIDYIDLVCEYLEKNEPSNPAQLLLRRSKRMLNRDFIELVRELAPDALNDVARIFGIDPNENTSSDY